MHLPILLFLSLVLPALCKQTPLAPLIKISQAPVLKDKYIIKFRSECGNDAMDKAIYAIHGTGKVGYVYISIFRGFSARLNKLDVLKLRRNRCVAYIEQDTSVTYQGATVRSFPDKVPPGESPAEAPGTEAKLSWDTIRRRLNKIGQRINQKLILKIGQWIEERILKTGQKSTVTQRHAPWGLARISNLEPYHYTYTYHKSAGTGTCVYVVDSGIDLKNPLLRDRTEYLARLIGEDYVDGSGHGTHVASTIGARWYGVAQNTTLLAVRVMDDYGETTTSTVLAGMDFVYRDSALRTEKCPKGIVVNMSIAGPRSTAINEAAKKITNAGLFLSVAAGNLGWEAFSQSPASSVHACTAGATSADDKFAPYSNWGPLVNVLAPGTNILSVYRGTLVASKSGTSMASAHLAGLAAYFLGLGMSVEGLCDYISAMAVKDVVKMDLYNGTGTPNLLINSGMQSAAMDAQLRDNEMPKLNS